MKSWFFRAEVLALMTILLWSTLAVLGVHLSQVPPFFLMAMALLIGSTCGLSRVHEWKIPFRTLLLGVGGIFGYHLFVFLALRMAPPVEANLINYLWPLLMVVLSPLILTGFRLRWTHLLGAALGFSGALLLTTGGELAWSKSESVGYLFAAAAAITWACYSLLSKKVAPFPNSAVGLFCLVSGLLSLLLHVLFEPRFVPSSNESMLLFLLGIGPMGAAFFLWDRAMKTGDPRKIGSLSYLTPMLSTLWLALFSDARFSALSFIAMMMILLGAIIGSYSKPLARLE